MKINFSILILFLVFMLEAKTETVKEKKVQTYTSKRDYANIPFEQTSNIIPKISTSFILPFYSGYYVTLGAFTGGSLLVHNNLIKRYSNPKYAYTSDSTIGAKIGLHASACTSKLGIGANIIATGGLDYTLIFSKSFIAEIILFLPYDFTLSLAKNIQLILSDSGINKSSSFKDIAKKDKKNYKVYLHKLNDFYMSIKLPVIKVHKVECDVLIKANVAVCSGNGWYFNNLGLYFGIRGIIKHIDLTVEIGTHANDVSSGELESDKYFKIGINYSFDKKLKRITNKRAQKLLRYVEIGNIHTNTYYFVKKDDMLAL